MDQPETPDRSAQLVADPVERLLLRSRGNSRYEGLEQQLSLEWSTEKRCASLDPPPKALSCYRFFAADGILQPPSHIMNDDQADAPQGF